MRRAAAAFLLGLLTIPSCTYAEGDSRVLVTSTPAGALILVDGEDTGLTTPSMVELDGFLGDDHVVTLRKVGFDPEDREVIHHTHAYTSKWQDGTDFRIWPLPLFWTLGDFLTPFAVKWRYVPHEFHVTLYPEGESPKTEPSAPDR
ncbi:MAG: PEGA domain-containing protein [Planctomycetota bacterium]|nr:PEGA domain-containing protein [Planctomycetota bacterium]